MTLTPSQARAFYDRFGKKQDTQAFYEDPALDNLVAHADFGHAESAFELGCGTGRFAVRLLGRHLPGSATYLGIDISRTMIGIAEQRLAPYAERARVAQSDGSMSFPLADHSVDRVVSTYVLDLLSEDMIGQALSEAHRVLAPHGRLCVMSLTNGRSFGSRILTGAWSALFRMNASLVGGCRPIRLSAFVDGRHWTTEYGNVVTRFGVPSEIVIATPKR